MSRFYKEEHESIDAGLDEKKQKEFALKAQQLLDGQIQNRKFIIWANKQK